MTLPFQLPLETHSKNTSRLTPPTNPFMQRDGIWSNSGQLQILFIIPFCMKYFLILTLTLTLTQPSLPLGVSLSCLFYTYSCLQLCQLHFNNQIYLYLVSFCLTIFNFILSSSFSSSYYWIFPMDISCSTFYVSNLPAVQSLVQAQLFWAWLEFLKSTKIICSGWELLKSNVLLLLSLNVLQKRFQWKHVFFNTHVTLRILQLLFKTCLKCYFHIQKAV